MIRNEASQTQSKALNGKEPDATGESAEAALQESERRLRALVTASSDVVYRMSPDWRVMYQLKRNMEGERFLAETEQANPHWLNDYIHPDDQPNVLARIDEAIRTKSIFEFEHRVRQADGTLGWTHSRAVPILDEEGQIREWFGMAADTTAKKRASDLLIQSEKLTAMGRLAASIAHEINNPLEAVTNLLYLARTSKDFEQARSYLNDAEQELSRAVSIGNQTLRFHKQSSNPTEVLGGELLRNVLLVHRGRILNARVRVEERIRCKRPVRCFEGEVRQVISNLVGNATDAMQQRGGRLLVRCREGHDWRTGQKGSILTVADTGPGMSAETREKAFEAFYTTKGMEGTGLGLWVSAEIVLRHNGRLLVRSSQAERHHGTVFALFLPYDAVSR